jgi:hypothetical protein
MRIRLPKNANGKLLQKAIAVIVLSALVAEVAGMPVAQPAGKDRSRPFPCQDRPCGCASADECWHHCCCMTNKEKLAWADGHGVTPPDFVVAAAEKEEAEQPAQVCCHDESCDAAPPEEAHACCRARHQHHEVASTEADAHQKDSRSVRFVLSDLARRCNGLPPLILFMGDALPGVASVEWEPAELVAGYVEDVVVPCVSAELAPPVPPPKLRRGAAA